MKLTNEKARRAAMMAIDQLASEEDKMAERAIKGYIEHLEMELMEMYSKYTTSEARSVLLVDETKRLRTELATMKAAEVPAIDVSAFASEPDYEAYRAAQEKAHWDMLDQMEDARELDEYFEEHGVEPGGTCPDCGRTNAGCSCERI